MGFGNVETNLVLPTGRDLYRQVRLKLKSSFSILVRVAFTAAVSVSEVWSWDFMRFSRPGSLSRKNLNELVSLGFDCTRGRPASCC
jgi:hypothetical protein